MVLNALTGVQFVPVLGDDPQDGYVPIWRSRYNAFVAEPLIFAPPEIVDIADVDLTGPWIDNVIIASEAGVDGTGPWVDGATSSLEAGVDGTGPWIEDN